MPQIHPHPNVGEDGHAVAPRSGLIGGRTSGDLQKDFSALTAGSKTVLPVQMTDASGNALETFGGTPGTPGDGTATLTAAGTAQRVTAGSVPCKRVFIQAHQDNGDAVVVVGASTVVAAAGTRRGKALLATQGDWFFVSDINNLFFDATATGAKIHFYYES